MARKRKNEGGSRAKGASREKLILAIVATDSTFTFNRTDDRDPSRGVWLGKCIHCGRKLGVDQSGRTAATIEHVLPLCAGGDSHDPRNLALACSGCNNEKGVRHDQHVGKGGRADEVVTALQGKRLARWREP